MIVENLIIPLMDAWVLNWHRVDDNKRNMKTLAHSLVEPGNWWSNTGKDWIWFRKQGMLTILGEDESEKVRSRLKAHLNVVSINRLTAVVPVSVSEYSRFLKEIGFRQEGILREAVLYGGQMEDAYVMGFLTRDKKGRRRRRVKR